MENGRSPVLGSGLSEPEGTELMEGAAAAVGRQQRLDTIVAPSLTSLLYRLTVYVFDSSPQALWSFRCRARVRVNRTTPKNPSRLRPQRSPVCIRLTVLNRRSPDLQRYTNNLLRYHPNPSTGYLITLQVGLSPWLMIAYVTRCMYVLSHLPSPCRRCPGEVAVYVDEVISSSTSKEAHDLRTCREHGALFARLPKMPRPSQPCSNGRALPAVRDATCPPPPTQPNHRGAQQDAGPHHAEV